MRVPRSQSIDTRRRMYYTSYSYYPHSSHWVGGNQKRLTTIDERGSKIARNSVFDCHLSHDRRQIAIENSVSNDFYLRSSIILTFSIAAYPVCSLLSVSLP